MKKKIFILIILIVILNLSSCANYKNGQGFNAQNLGELKELSYEEIVNKIIRFHVIANSNTDEDQALKLKVRDKVIEYVSSSLSNSTSLEESRNFILSNKDNIEAIAQEVISENGYNYNVTSTLSKENFPDKVYGDVVFPQGEYEAYRILIGDAEGENWWCVMFPPLCFVDGTKEAVDSTKVVNSLENDNIEEIKENKIEFKLKLFEIINKK